MKRKYSYFDGKNRLNGSILIFLFDTYLPF